MPTEVIVEHVPRNEPGSNPAGNGFQLAVVDQTANLFLGAAELLSNLAYGQGGGPVHALSIAAPLPAPRRSPGAASPLERPPLRG